MKYQPPRCECGHLLHIYDEEIKAFNIPICKNGNESKRKIITGCGEGAERRLECENCGKEYWIENDKKGRYVRGEKWDSWILGNEQ